MQFTNDQYHALGKLEKWYRDYSHQIIDISAPIGTGVWQLIQKFIELVGFDPREVMYLSYDQKQVLELAAKRYHAYYIDRIIYNYTRIVDFDSLPVLNVKSNEVKSKWIKNVKNKIDERYKIIVVFDSVLLNESTLLDLSSFGLPIILIRDPILIPAPDTYTFLRDPNLELRELHPDLIKDPIVYFAHKVLAGEKLNYGNYDNVSIVPKKQLNLYNFRSADMILTISEELSRETNRIFREKVMKLKTIQNVAGERVIVMNNMYAHKLVNPDEKKIKLYLTRGTIGYINKCNKHAIMTRYVPMEFRTDFYYDIFTDLYMDRHYLNGITTPSRQQIPDEIIKLQYAYSLPVTLARLSHWDKVTLIADQNEDLDRDLQIRMMYSAISKARSMLTIVI